MKTIKFALLMALAVALGAQTQPAKSAPTKPPATRPADPAPATPPADAKQIDASTFHWKDAKGEVWVYKKTPFGWSKMREKELSSYQRPDEKPAPIEVVDVRGESVTFEKPTPFGPSRWTKKKSDLSADERSAMERWSNRAATSARTAPAGKE
jgi:hypothetical protein